MESVELLQHINEIHDTAFTFVERYTQGEQGAFALADPDGKRYVLKWQPGREHSSRLHYIRMITQHLRARGYPTPDYPWIGYTSGFTYAIQAALPGVPISRMTPSLLTRLIELNELQIAQAPAGPSDWPREVVDTVLVGGQGYCLHASLRQHSSATATLLLRLQEIVIAYKNAIKEQNDIVHFDFNPANLLVHEQAVSGVIDWDGASAGDATFDLATLLFYIYDDVVLRREHLWPYLSERSSLPVLSVYLAHMILRQVDWSLRHHDPATYNFYIARGQAILEDISHL